MSEEITRMPAVALRGMTILPSMIVHFDVSRDKSIKAIEQDSGPETVCGNTERSGSFRSGDR